MSDSILYMCDCVYKKCVHVVVCMCGYLFHFFAGRSSTHVVCDQVSSVCVCTCICTHVCAIIVFSHSQAQRDLSTAKLEYSKMHQQMMQVSECTQ